MPDTLLLAQSPHSENCCFVGCHGSIYYTTVDTYLLLWKNSLGSDKKTGLPIQQHWRTIRYFPNGKEKHSENISHCCNLFCHMLVK